MSFTLMACTDIRAQKVNIELPFEEPPASVEVLCDVLEHLFRKEEEEIKFAMSYTDTRPCEPFTINRLQRYDDDAQSWADVTSIAMLQTYDQLYVFRKNSTKADISTQRELPPPRPSEYFVDPSSGSAGATAAAAPHTPHAASRGRPSGGVAYSGGSVSPNRAPRSGGSPYAVSPTSSPAAAASAAAASSHRVSEHFADEDPYPASTALPVNGTASAAAPQPPPSSSSFYYKERTTPERVEYLFRLGSQAGGSGVLTEKSFEHIFRMADVAFPVEVVLDLYAHFTTSRVAGAGTGAVMTMEGFQEFATYFPVLVNITYQRITNQDREAAIRAAQRDNGKQLEHARRQVQELEARLAAARREAQQAEQRQARLQDDLYDLNMQRDPDYCQEEQKLLDKEVSVFKYRERLSREERDYERLAIERRKRAAATSARTRSTSPQGTYDPNRYGPRD